MEFEEQVQEEIPAFEDFQVEPCSVCSRKFRSDILPKHEKICAKASKRKPKIFDSGKMRATGTDIPVSKTIRPGEVVPREPHKDERLLKAERKRDNWRLKHKEFINTIRSAKLYQQAVSSGGPIPPPPPAKSSIDPDLIQCEYCQRRFNEKAADRHIPFCREKCERERARRGIAKSKQTAPIQTNTSQQPKPKQTAQIDSRQQFRSPVTSKGDGGNDSSLSNSRIRKSSAPKREAVKTTDLRSSSQKGGRMPSASTNVTNRGRYDNYDAGYLIDKPRSPVNSDINDDSNEAGNSTFDVDEYQDNNHPGPQDYINSLSNDHGGRIKPLRSLSSLRQERSTRSRPLSSSMRSLASVSGNESLRSQQRTRTDTRNVSPTEKAMNSISTSPPLTETPNSPSQFMALRTGRTYQDYVDAQVFARDLARTRLQTKQRPVALQKKMEARLPAPLRPGTTGRNAGQHRLLSSPTERPLQHQGQISQDTLEHIQRIGNRQEILASNVKMSGTRLRGVGPSASGIPVRATNIQAKREPSAGRQTTLPHQTLGNERSKGCFCRECGFKFSNSSARFCPDCGIRRMVV